MILKSNVILRASNASHTEYNYFIQAWTSEFEWEKKEKKEERTKTHNGEQLTVGNEMTNKW